MTYLNEAYETWHFDLLKLNLIITFNMGVTVTTIYCNCRSILLCRVLIR